MNKKLGKLQENYFKAQNPHRFIQKSVFGFRARKILNAYLGFVAIWAINISTIFRSSWAGDDWPISQTPYWIQWRYGELNNWNIWTEALFWNDQWMKGAGRFYPLTWIESRFVFSYFRELWQYKLYQVIMLFIAGMLLVLICYLFTKSHLFTILTLASLSLTVQFRRDFDPHLAFSVMLPSLLIKVFLSTILIFFAGRISKKFIAVPLAIFSALLYFAAMSTYEFGFLLFPMLLIAHLLGLADGNRNTQRLGFYLRSAVSLRFFPVVVSWIGYGLFVFAYLRPRATAISGSYVLGISWSSIEVFLSQAIMGLPLISLRDGDLNFSLFSSVVSTVLIYLSVRSLRFLWKYKKDITLKTKVQNSVDYKFKENHILLMLFCLSMILSPGFMMSIQPAWWDRADISHTYLGVMITEFGTAMLIALILERFFNQNRYSSVAEKKKV